MKRTSGWPFAASVLAREIVDSTSNVAAGLVRQGTESLPLLVWARRQTAGRGRGSHGWWSDAGSLTFTVAIDPASHRVPVGYEPALALATAVAVIEAIHELDRAAPSVGIRWPNDLDVDGRKLGGILPERVETEDGHRVLIGVGLNVLCNFADAPEEIRSMATSLASYHAEYWNETVLPELLSAILRRLESVLRRLVENDPLLPAEWNRLDVLRDRLVEVDTGEQIVTARGLGIDAQGALCLHDGWKELRLFGGQVLRPAR
jgi:BirA family biotin operon repressor/biotin-[acetyl-CoA-carboxylase] ligase